MQKLPIRDWRGGRSGAAGAATARAYARSLAAHARPDTRAALGQLLGGLAYFAACWAGIWWALSFSVYVALLLVVPTAAGMIRLFVIQHDCGHRSFFGSRAANDWTGRLLSLLTLMPYTSWRRFHDAHHAASGDLERRGVGDLWTLTLAEYRRLPAWRRAVYRLQRSPLGLFGLGGLYLLLTHRLPYGASVDRRTLWWSTQGTNLGLVALWGAGAWLAGGLGTFLAIQLPIVFVYFVFGVFLFYVEHQFPGMRWWRGDAWDFHAAALYGSSFLDLGCVLRWFAGGIGVHHVHHLKVRIPNYRMRECLAAHPELRSINRITLRQALGSCRLALWDEKEGQLVGFGQVRESAGAASVAGGLPCRA